MKCAVCQKNMSALDFIDSLKIKDGRCCSSCWKKFGSLLSSKRYSSADVRAGIERSSASILAYDKVRKFYHEKCEEIKLPNEEWKEIKINLWNVQYCWVREKALHFVESENDYRNTFDLGNIIFTTEDVDKLIPLDLKHTIIPIESIQYFAKDGDIQFTSNISGGGGGGSSLAGAIVGGMIAGEAGAIIGSRQQANPIRTTTIRHDSSKTIIKYYDELGMKTLVYDGYFMYDFLLENVPEKEFSSVQLVANDVPNDEKMTVKEQLKVLKELYEEGLIENEEYSAKKLQILQRI